MSKPIRVLQIVGKMHRAGLETFIMNVYHNINREKIQFDFLVHYLDRGDYDDEIESMGGKIYRMPVMQDKNIFKYIKQLHDFFKEHKEYQIIHGQWTTLGLFYMYFAKRNGVKVRIAHSHNTNSENSIKGFFVNILQKPLQYLCNYYFSCSTDAAYWIFSKNTINSGKVQIINNAIDTDLFKYSEDIRKLKREEMHLQDKFVIGHIGRFNFQKNHMFLLDVFKNIHDKNSNAVLLLVGDGELRPQIEEKIIDLNLEESVILTGIRADIADLYQVMDVFVFPSLFEGLGIVLVEAQAAGLYCVVADTVPHEAFITNSIEKISLNVSPFEWAEKILKHSNDYEREDTSEQIREAGYDIKEQSKWLEEFYLKNYEVGMNEEDIGIWDDK